MILFGTIGTVSRFISLPSAFMSCVRALISVAVISIWMYIVHSAPDFRAIMINLPRLAISGILLGANWVLMFEAFRYTTVAAASVCYYMQPVFLMLCAPFFFKEKLSPKKVLCIIAGFCGLILVTGLTGGTFTPQQLRGAFLAVIAAMMYTANIISNKRLADISSIDSTTAQILIAGITLLPYVCFTTDSSDLSADAGSILLLLVLAVLHTGIAYIVYYSSIRSLDAQTVAAMSYIDPVESVLLSVFILKEPMTIPTVIGSVLILGAAYIGSRSD